MGTPFEGFISFIRHLGAKTFDAIALGFPIFIEGVKGGGQAREQSNGAAANATREKSWGLPKAERRKGSQEPDLCGGGRSGSGLFNRRVPLFRALAGGHVSSWEGWL